MPERRNVLRGGSHLRLKMSNADTLVTQSGPEGSIGGYRFDLATTTTDAEGRA
jgi:hypothetical protein